MFRVASCLRAALPLLLIAGVIPVARAQVAPVRQEPLPVSTTTKPSAPLRFGVVNPALLADDPRLTQAKVATVEPRVYVAELLEQWQNQTNIVLEARDTPQDDSGRWQVMIALRNAITIADAMNALRSVLSQQGATWQWERSGTAPNYAYRLIRPLSLEARDAALKQAVQDDFENTVARIKKALTLSDAELKQAARNDKTGVLNRLLEPDGLVKQGMSAFFSNLNDEQQQKILRGGELELKYDALNESGKQYAVAFNKYMVEGFTQNGVQIPYDMPTRVNIGRDIAPGAIMPFLLIQVSGDKGGGGGWGYTDKKTHEAQWRDRVVEEVFLRDDAKIPGNNTLLAQMITPMKEDIPPSFLPAQGGRLMRRDLEKSLLDLARAESPSVNFLARLPQIEPTGSIGVYGRTLTELITELRKHNVAAKWNGDTLLLCSTAGFTYNDGVATLPPYAAYRFVSEHLDAWATTKYPPLNDLMQLTRLATKEQWEGLYLLNEKAFPFFEPHELPRSYELLAAMASAPSEIIEQMTSATGVPIARLPTSFNGLLNIPPATPGSSRLVYRLHFAPKGTTIVSQDWVEMFWAIKPTAETRDEDLRPTTIQWVGGPVPSSWQQVIATKKP